jgi:hypothetical protein
VLDEKAEDVADVKASPREDNTMKYLACAT